MSKKRKISESQNGPLNNSAPPSKKAKQIDDKADDVKENVKETKFVVIGLESKQLPTKLLTKLPYFAKLAKQSANAPKQIVISANETNFTINDLAKVLGCYNINGSNAFQIPTDLEPQSTFLSFMHCMAYFRADINDSMLKAYYNNCTKPIGSDALHLWKATNIAQIAQFGSQMLTKRSNRAVQMVTNSIKTEVMPNIDCTYVRLYGYGGLSQKYIQKSPRPPNPLKTFEEKTKFLLNNVTNNSDLTECTKVINEFVANSANQLKQWCLRENNVSYGTERSNENCAIEFVVILLKLLFGSSKYEKLFGMIYGPIVSLVSVFCKSPVLCPKMNGKVKEEWKKIVNFVFNGHGNNESKYAQLRIDIISKTLCIIIDDATVMNSIFEKVTNKVGEDLAYAIVGMNMNNENSKKSMKEKYADFVSKYVNL